MTTNDALEQFQKDATNAMIQSAAYKRARAFGVFEAFIKSPASFVLTDNRLTQYGPPYSWSIDKGIAPTGRIDRKQVADIYDWLALKKYGLDWKTTKERSRIALRIAGKIAGIGSYKFRNKTEQTNIIGDAVMQSVPALESNLTKAFTFQIKSAWQIL